MDIEPMLTSNMNDSCHLLQKRATCAICGAPAIGRNFDAMTCLSCKAFFRRNAYNENLIFTCRVSNSCEVTMATRRYCSACRLKKCFKQGMKKELIRSLSAINHASSLATTQKSRFASSTIPTLDLLNHRDRSSLTLDDWNLLTNIRNAYDEFCVQPFIDSHQTVPLIPPKQPYRARLKLQRLVDLKYKYMLVIASFARRILQFDRYTSSVDHAYPYIKENIPCLITTNACELMKSKALDFAPWEHDRLALESVLSEEIIFDLNKVLGLFRQLAPQDPIIVKMYLIVLTLSSGIMPIQKKDEYQPSDFEPLPRSFLSRQNFYLSLLWKYIQHRLGYQSAVLLTARFVQIFLQRQEVEANINDVIKQRNDHDQLVHLIEVSMTF